MAPASPAAAVLEELGEAATALDGEAPEAVLRWASERYGEGLTLACSFGGVSGMALVDMVSKLELGIEVFYLDTGFLFPETYALVGEVERRYGMHAVAYRPSLSPEEQAKEFGEALWSSAPDMCCTLRKVEPNYRALAGKGAWVTGLRRDQSSDRRTVRPVEWDWKFGLTKISPLAAWTEDHVFDYIREHDVPYNALHDEGYPSIGCTYCTRPVAPGEDPRAGRWAGFSKTECGLHLTSSSQWRS